MINLVTDKWVHLVANYMINIEIVRNNSLFSLFFYYACKSSIIPAFSHQICHLWIANIIGLGLVYMFVCVCVFVFVCIRVYVFVCTHACMHVCACVCACVCVSACICVCVWSSICHAHRVNKDIRGKQGTFKCLASYIAALQTTEAINIL